jgi:predicted metal-dependent peptidase
MERVKVAILHLEPFLGSMVRRIRYIYTFHVATQATDGYNIFVNPQFTYNLDFEQKVFVLEHEIMHCIMDHMRRGKQAGHDPMKSNIAADYEVNSTLVELGFTSENVVRKTKALFDHKWDGKAYEQIYAANPSMPSPGTQSNSNQAQQAKNNQKGGQQSGGNSGDSQQKHSKEWVDGWNQAMKDYKAGKIKL